MNDLYDDALNEVIQEAGRALDQIEQAVLNLNKRKQPMPSRKALRDNRNFIQSVFDNEPTLPKNFLTLFRMSRRLFNCLLMFIEDELEDDATNSIPPRDKLAMYLLFVGSGWTTHHISAVTLYGEKTVRFHVVCVAKAILQKMTRFISIPKTATEWKKIAQGFEERTCLPNCIGALDGKYIYLRKPDNAGSQWFCHKLRHALVLMALVDSTYKFLWIDVGSFGSNNDAFIFNSCNLCNKMEESSLNVPEQTRLPDSNISFPFYFVGDDAFALRTWLMKPLKRGDQQLSENENEANYRISLARRCVEQAFGILVKKFAILQRSIQMNHENLICVTQSLIVVHNFLRTESLQEEEEMYDTHVAETTNGNRLMEANIADNVPFYNELVPERLRTILFQYLTHEGRIPEQIGKNGNIS